MIVVDCSLVMSGILSDEEDTLAEKIFSELIKGKLQALVPAHFYLEAQNVLLTAFRKKRINQEIWHEYFSVLEELPFEIEQAQTNKEFFTAISKISEHYGLTIYDAIYLEISKRHKIKLATLDKKLQMAADKEKVLYK